MKKTLHIQNKSILLKNRKGSWKLQNCKPKFQQRIKILGKSLRKNKKEKLMRAEGKQEIVEKIEKNQTMWSNIQHNRSSRKNRERNYQVSKKENFQFWRTLILTLKDPMSTKHSLKKEMNIKAYYGEISAYQEKEAHKMLQRKML